MTSNGSNSLCLGPRSSLALFSALEGIWWYKFMLATVCDLNPFRGTSVLLMALVEDIFQEKFVTIFCNVSPLLFLNSHSLKEATRCIWLKPSTGKVNTAEC